MTRSELIETLANKYAHISLTDIDKATRAILDTMTEALSTGERIEIRGFGSFSIHRLPARVGRNPKTGDAVDIPGKPRPHFKPGKELRGRVDASRHGNHEELEDI